MQRLKVAYWSHCWDASVLACKAKLYFCKFTVPWFHNSTRKRTKKIGEGNCHRSSKLNFPVISYAHFKRSEVKDPPTLLQPYIITCAKAAEKIIKLWCNAWVSRGFNCCCFTIVSISQFFLLFPSPLSPSHTYESVESAWRWICNNDKV